jgi:hypothetical protein
LRQTKPLALDQLAWGHSGGLLEATRERPRAQGRTGGEVAGRDAVRQVFSRPVEDGAERLAERVRRERVVGVLQLTTCTEWRHDEPSGNLHGDVEAMVEGNDVQAEVDAGDRACRRHDRAVDDIEDGGIDLDVGVTVA